MAQYFATASNGSSPLCYVCDPQSAQAGSPPLEPIINNQSNGYKSQFSTNCSVTSQLQVALVRSGDKGDATRHYAPKSVN